MRIGVMLRAWGEKGGVGVYTRNIVPELLDLDQDNQYVLFFRESSHLGSFANHPPVTERLVRAPNKALWDQVAVPWACFRDKVDVVFHPKFTVPLLAPCRAVMVVHGTDWFMPEQAQFYRRLDVRYIKTMMPLYFRKASAVISVSQLTTDNFNRVLDLPPGKVQTVYFAPARHFGCVTNEAVLETVRARYGLPERFVVTLTKVGGDTRKNFGQMVQAYARYHSDRNPVQAGCGRPRLSSFAGCLWHSPGWMGDRRSLSRVDSAAGSAGSLLAGRPLSVPVKSGSLSIPVTEAMACGTPLITSNVNGLHEIAGDAAVLVDPGDVHGISNAIGRVLSDFELARRAVGTRSGTIGAVYVG